MWLITKQMLWIIEEWCVNYKLEACFHWITLTRFRREKYFTWIAALISVFSLLTSFKSLRFFTNKKSQHKCKWRGFGFHSSCQIFSLKCLFILVFWCWLLDVSAILAIALSCPLVNWKRLWIRDYTLTWELSCWMFKIPYQGRTTIFLI